MDHVAKRARVEVDPMNFRISLSSLVGNVPAILKNLEGQGTTVSSEDVEVEIRLGMLVSNDRRLHSRDQLQRGHIVDPTRKSEFSVEFKSGVDLYVAKKIKERFQLAGFQATAPVNTTLYCSDRGERFSKNADDQFVTVDKKDRLVNYDVGLSSHDYDIRISIAREVKNSSNVAIPSADWTIQRVKRRICYTHAKNSHWKVDLTEVTSQPRSITTLEASEREIELEFELQSATQRSWLTERDPQKQMALGQQICEQLIGLVDLCLCCEPESDPVEIITNLAKTGPGAAPLPPKEEVERKIAEINGMLDETSRMRNENNLANRRKVNVDFLGSMPVNLFRRNLAIVLERDYFVTEKTDGTRFLLFSLPASSDMKATAVLLDRSRAIFTFPGAEMIAAALGERTVLDGELVYNITLKKSVFMVFDVLMYRGQSVVDKPFSERLSVLIHTVFPAYTPAMADNRSAMELLPKRFFKKAGLQTLLSQIVEHHGERVYRDKEGRHHFTDGIIFQPDGPYVFSRHFDLLKWKWADLRSVDLIVADPSMTGAGGSSSSSSGGDNDVHFMCSGPNEGLVDCSKRGDRNVGVGKFDRYRLRKEVYDLLQERGRMRILNKFVIAEMTYDVQIGMWTYKKIRKDKTEPNFIDSVLGVFIEQAEAIGREELEYALICSSNGWENDYDQRLGKMKGTLLEWQRKGRK